MRKMFLITLSLMLLFIVTACSKETTPDEKMFEVGSDDLTNIQASQPFQISGYIKNKSKHKWDISHGADIFTYEIYDSDGNLVKQEYDMLFTNSIGYLSELKPKTEFRNNYEEHRSKEYYEFQIEKPGTYKVKTIATFRIENGDERVEFVLSSNELNEFIVK
jgi:hypothetical protein